MFDVKLAESNIHYLPEKVEKFLISKQKSYDLKNQTIEIEEAYFYEDCFTQILEKIDGLKLLFQRCRKDL